MISVGGGVSSYNDLTDVPTEFPPEAHTHEIADVNLLPGALDDLASDLATANAALAGKQDRSEKNQPGGYAGISNFGFISQFVIPSHSQEIGTITGLIDELNGKQAVLGFTPEDTAQKGVAGGYASLDGTGKVPAGQLPSYVDDVIEAANFAALPVTGETGKIYITLDTNAQYRWSGSAYTQITASPGTTDAVPEGTGNLYFTEARVRNTVLTGYAVALSRTALAATDTVLVAFGKIGKALADLAAIAFSGSASDLTAGTLPAARFDDTSHGSRAGGALHAGASGSVAGFMSAADKTKLDAITGTNTGDQTITLTGDVAGSGSGSFATTIAADAVTNSKLANMPATTIKGNATGAAADPADLTGTQATALLDPFTSAAKGLAPASGGGTTNFLRADGSWVAPPGGGGTAISSVEIDVGPLPVKEASINVVDAAVTPTTKITASQSGRAATGRPADENQWTRLHVVASPNTGSFDLWVVCLNGTMSGKFNIDYLKG